MLTRALDTDFPPHPLGTYFFTPCVYTQNTRNFQEIWIMDEQISDQIPPLSCTLSEMAHTLVVKQCILY